MICRLAIDKMRASLIKTPVARLESPALVGALSCGGPFHPSRLGGGSPGFVKETHRRNRLREEMEKQQQELKKTPEKPQDEPQPQSTPREKAPGKLCLSPLLLRDRESIVHQLTHHASRPRPDEEKRLTSTDMAFGNADFGSLFRVAAR